MSFHVPEVVAIVFKESGSPRELQFRESTLSTVNAMMQVLKEFGQRTIQEKLLNQGNRSLFSSHTSVSSTKKKRCNKVEPVTGKIFFEIAHIVHDLAHDSHLVTEPCDRREVFHSLCP
jgi:hypothetical protein